MLSPLGIEVIPQGLLGIPSCEEPFPSFVENAITKARHASKLSGLPALADDSGICVDALNGLPGVLSARFALSDQKKDPSDEDNNALLIKKLAGVSQRSAHFTCTLVYLESADDPEPLIAVGKWHGQIIETPKGQAGFGYDPLFFVPELGKTAAELSAEEKNSSKEIEANTNPRINYFRLAFIIPNSVSQFVKSSYISLGFGGNVSSFFTHIL